MCFLFSSVMIFILFQSEKIIHSKKLITAKTSHPVYNWRGGFSMTREERINVVINALDEGARIIALDGRCAGGKSTLAEDVARIRDISIVHMDDFFLPPSLRTRERFSEAGGNVHWERFIEEVISKLCSEEGFSYRVFSCSKMDYDGERRVMGGRPVIIEGSYALHPRFPVYWDKAFFLTVSREEQLRRLEKRCPEKLEDFKAKWIPLEEDYFLTARTAERADRII